MKPITPGPDLLRPGEKLHEDDARQLESVARPGCSLVRDLQLELIVKCADFPGEKHEMQQDVGGHDKKQARRENKKTDERQIYVQERQLNRLSKSRSRCVTPPAAIAR
jgi:hypothetical protein